MRTWGLALSITGLIAGVASAAPLAYTGYAVTFEKVADADESMPENQDQIVNGISITRGSTQGIFNIAQETSYQGNLSPVGTTWAFTNNNPGVTLSAANYVNGCPEIAFEGWVTANGGAGGGPPNTVGQDAIVHLVEQDIYLDIRFTSWGQGFGSGGAFSYERAAITPSADFDRDGDVDGRDFLTWQRNYGMAEALQSQGDADFDGVVTSDDLQIWEASYGSALLAIATVPEPRGALLAMIFGSALAIRRA